LKELLSSFKQSSHREKERERERERKGKKKGTVQVHNLLKFNPGAV